MPESFTVHLSICRGVACAVETFYPTGISHLPYSIFHSHILPAGNQHHQRHTLYYDALPPFSALATFKFLVPRSPHYTRASSTSSARRRSSGSGTCTPALRRAPCASKRSSRQTGGSRGRRRCGCATRRGRRVGSPAFTRRRRRRRGRARRRVDGRRLVRTDAWTVRSSWCGLVRAARGRATGAGAAWLAPAPATRRSFLAGERVEGAAGPALVDERACPRWREVKLRSSHSCRSSSSAAYDVPTNPARKLKQRKLRTCQGTLATLPWTTATDLARRRAEAPAGRGGRARQAAWPELRAR
jgi:hypothetical protein